MAVQEFARLAEYLLEKGEGPDRALPGGPAGLDHPTADGVFLLAVDPDGEDEGGDPDGCYEDVDDDGQQAAHADGLEEGLHVRKEDDAADGRTEDAGRQDAHDVGGYRGGDDPADEERADHGPGDLGEA